MFTASRREAFPTDQTATRARPCAIEISESYNPREQDEERVTLEAKQLEDV